MPTAPETPHPIDPAAPAKPQAADHAAAAADRAGGTDNGFDGSNGKNRGPLVGLILGLLVASTVVMVAFIWFRWSGVREPTTAVIFRSEPSLAGTEITVAGERTVTATLDGTKSYVPILVDPGEYVVSAELRGQTMFRTRVEVKRFVGVEFDLPRIAKEAVARGVLTLDTPPASPAATRPG
jgi:hypothetical protein